MSAGPLFNTVVAETEKANMGHVIMALLTHGAPRELAENLFTRVSKSSLLEETRRWKSCRREPHVPNALFPGESLHLLHATITINLHDQEAAEAVEGELRMQIVDALGVARRPVETLVFCGALECSIREVSKDVFTFSWKQRYVSTRRPS